MTLQKKMLKRIPKQYHFEYLLAWKQLMMVRDSLKGYEPKTKEDEEWVGQTLRNYKKYFLQIANINSMKTE